MVVRQSRGLVVEQPLTRERELLAAALSRLAERRAPVLDTAGRSLLLREIEHTEPPEQAFEVEDDQMAENCCGRFAPRRRSSASRSTRRPPSCGR